MKGVKLIKVTVQDKIGLPIQIYCPWTDAGRTGLFATICHKMFSRTRKGMAL